MTFSPGANMLLLTSPTIHKEQLTVHIAIHVKTARPIIRWRWWVLECVFHVYFYIYSRTSYCQLHSRRLRTVYHQTILQLDFWWPEIQYAMRAIHISMCIYIHILTWLTTPSSISTNTALAYITHMIYIYKRVEKSKQKMNLQRPYLISAVFHRYLKRVFVPRVHVPEEGAHALIEVHLFILLTKQCHSEEAHTKHIYCIPWHAPSELDPRTYSLVGFHTDPRIR